MKRADRIVVGTAVVAVVGVAVAAGAMLRALPADARVYGVIEIEAACDRLPLPRGAELRRGRLQAGMRP